MPVVWCRQVSVTVSVSVVILYISCCLLLPLTVKACNILRWKINNIITSESYYTHTSPSKVFSSPSGTKSGSNLSVSSHGISMVAKEKAAASEEALKKLT